MKKLYSEESGFLGHHYILGLLVVIAIALVGSHVLTATHAAPIAGWTPVYTKNFPDPTIMKYNGQFYAYATASQGFHIPTAVSPDAVHWTPGADAFPALPTWATGGLWAPTVVHDVADSKFIMFYSAQDVNLSNTRCIGEATSSSPVGPFVDSSSKPIFCQPNHGGTIDPSVFTAADGTHYLYVKNAGNSAGLADSLWVQPLSSSFTPIGDFKWLLTTDQKWQGATVEGPEMVLLGNKYFLFYAGADYLTSRYAIGYATCSSPVGPCKDSPQNPFIASSGGMLGPGSPAAFVNYRGQTRMVFAAWVGSVSNYRGMYEATIVLKNGLPAISAKD